MEKPEDYENTGSVPPSDVRFPFQVSPVVRDILFEIIRRHPRGKDGLSEKELIKLLYLVDWKIFRIFVGYSPLLIKVFAMSEYCRIFVV